MDQFTELSTPKEMEVPPVLVEKFTLGVDTDSRLQHQVLQTYRAALAGKPYVADKTRAYLLVNLFALQDPQDDIPPDQYKNPTKLAQIQEILSKNPDQLDEKTLEGTKWVKMSRKFGTDVNIEFIIPSSEEDTRQKDLLEGKGLEEFLDSFAKFRFNSRNPSEVKLQKTTQDLLIDLAQNLPKENTEWSVFKLKDQPKMPVASSVLEHIEMMTSEYWNNYYARRNPSNDGTDEEKKIEEMKESPFVVLYRNVDGVNVGFVHDGLSPLEALRYFNIAIQKIPQVLRLIPKEYQSDYIDIIGSPKGIIIPKGSENLGHASQDVIFLRTDPAATLDRNLSDSLNHEIVHQMLARSLGNPSNSKYLMEGLATWIGTNGADPDKISRARRDNYLEDWEESKQLPNKGYHPYGLGELLVKYIAERYGIKTLFEVYKTTCDPNLSQYADKETDANIFEQVCKKKFRVDFNEFMENFREYLENQKSLKITTS